MRLRHAALSAPLILMGCTDPSGDPCATANREITFGNMLGSSLSGSYDACISNLQADLAAIRLENSELRARADRLRRESASLSAEESRLLAEEAALRREIDSLSRSDAPDPGEVTRVRERQRELNRQFGLIFG
jgi:hypothetical protein